MPDISNFFQTKKSAEVFSHIKELAPISRKSENEIRKFRGPKYDDRTDSRVAGAVSSRGKIAIFQRIQRKEKK